MLYTYDFHCQFTRSLSFASFQRRNIDPSSRPVALQSRAENRELPQSIDELRVLGCRARRVDRCIESPEDLFEGVVVAFAMAAWKICVAPRRGFQ